MKRTLLFGVLALLCLAPALRAEENQEGDLHDVILSARDRVYPALVNISVIVEQYRAGRTVRSPSQGSGVIVSPGGHILTNYHVAAHASRLTCSLITGERIPADVVTHDPLTDLSVLKLRLHERADPTQPIPFAAFGDSDALQVGDRVLALGNPRGLDSSMTLGIVASTHRVFKSFTGSGVVTRQLPTGESTGLLTQFIQHDALIQPGNSGGPLINLEGEVVGINELGGGGMAFAIPSNLARKVLNRVLTFGGIERGWLGVTVLPVEGLGLEHGVLLGAVVPDYPAAEAGLLPGDVVLRIGDTDLDVRRLDGIPVFYAWVAGLAVGSKHKVVYLRGGEQHETDVTIGKMEASRGETRVFPIWGMTARAITGPVAFARYLDNTKGALISGVRPGTAPEVARPALRAGDVVLEIGGDEVLDLDSFHALQKKHRKVKDLLVRFVRGRRDMVTALDMTRKPPRRRGSELAKAWLGVESQVLTPTVARALGLEGKKGLRVTWVLPGSEAEKAGLLEGDVLVSLDDEAIEASRLQDAEILRRRIEDMDIGSDATLGILRAGEALTLDVTLEETPETASNAKTADDEVLEYTVRELTYLDKVGNRWALDVKGVIVSKVESGGWANVTGLSTGDLLLEVQGAAIGNLKDFKRETAALAKAKPDRVQLFVRRGRVTTYIFIEPEWPAE